MRKVKSFLIIGLATMSLMLLMPSVAAAADTKGTLAIVNGIPGKRVDVCLNGHEIASGLWYGRKVLKPVVPSGTKNLKFFARDPRTCRGTLLAMRKFPLGAAADLTIVVTKNAPKVVTFDNVERGEIPPFGAPIFSSAPFAIRHAADLAVDFNRRFWSFGGEVPVSPAATFTKGQEFPSPNTTLVPGFVAQVRATLPGSPDVIASSATIEVIASHRYEWIFVGTKPVNARIVFLDRLVSQPTP